MLNEAIAEFPTKLKFLFQPHRYKVAYGGRGGAKSWGFARALLILGANSPLKILCARETQKSIKDSVHSLLESQVKALGLQEFYEVLQTSIIGKNGTEFSFAGIRQSSVADIKSFEGADICWVEEAHVVSKHSWDVLIPTIRKDGSEVWLTFNPDLETDETYQRFVLNPPSSAKVVQINWNDNPWFPKTLRLEMDELREKDAEGCANVYDGKCRQIGQGAYFGKVWDRVVREGQFGPIREPYAVVTSQQISQLVKPWWKRWMSGDWGFGHYTSYYWHMRGQVEPDMLRVVLGLNIDRPLAVVATYREWFGQGMSEREVGETLVSLCDDQELGKLKYNANSGIPEKVKALYFSPDAFEQSIRRSGQNSIAYEIGVALRQGGLPAPIKANNARVPGWRAMYGMLANTKAVFDGKYADTIWLISDACPQLIHAIPRATKDPDKLEDIIKTDVNAADVDADALDGCRYGILCREVSDRAEPQEAQDAEVIARVPEGDINSRYLMRGWLAQNRPKKPNGMNGW